MAAPVPTARTPVHHGYGDKSGNTLPGMRMKEARVIQQPTRATTTKIPASQAQSNTRADTRFTRTLLPIEDRDSRYHAAKQSPAIASALAHGTAGVVMRFALIIADQRPCGTK